MINSNYKNLANNCIASMGASLEKVDKKIEKFASQLPSRAENLANKITNFNGDSLKKMGKKLEKYSDNEVAKIKKFVTSMLHKLDDMTGGFIKGFCKKMDFPFPQKPASGQIKDFAKEFLGKENYQSFAKLGKDVKNGFNELKSDAKKIFT